MRERTGHWHAWAVDKRPYGPLFQAWGPTRHAAVVDLQQKAGSNYCITYFDAVQRFKELSMPLDKEFWLTQLCNMTRTQYELKEQQMRFVIYAHKHGATEQEIADSGDLDQRWVGNVIRVHEGLLK